VKSVSSKITTTGKHLQ